MSSLVEQIKNKIENSLKEALAKASKEELLPKIEPPSFVVEVPREKGNGDFSTNLAMLLAKPCRMVPRKIAEVLVEGIEVSNLPLAKLEIAGPGFINFYLKPTWVLEILPVILENGADYGRINLGQNKKVQLEFVSANPTGLLHMGNARGAALGDTTASILDFAGFKVSREFYINDAGNQIENFGVSLEARYLQLLGQDAPMPEDGYFGNDITETMKNFMEKYHDQYLNVEEKARKEFFVKYALEEKLTAIRNSLANFGVNYDVWFSEKSLHSSGAVDKAIKTLQENGYIYEKEGALWFKGKEVGLEKDEVVVRSNGVPTYYAADIAYHLNKFERGFEWVINVWGADHHGHVARMKGAIKALGYNPDALEVIIMQLVRLYRGGEIVRMSKRTGQFVTLDELVEEVGVDAARYFFVMRSYDSHLDFDLDLAKANTNDNPVYYVQYAYARICSILKQIDESKIDITNIILKDLEPLKEEAELVLARKLADFPEEIKNCVKDLAPHRLTHYLHEVASLFHSFYNAHRVISEDEALVRARLILISATKIVLGNCLRLLGVNAPESM